MRIPGQSAVDCDDCILCGGRGEVFYCFLCDLNIPHDPEDHYNEANSMKFPCMCKNGSNNLPEQPCQAS
jgi:hypothetical protein